MQQSHSTTKLIYKCKACRVLCYICTHTAARISTLKAESLLQHTVIGSCVHSRKSSFNFIGALLSPRLQDQPQSFQWIQLGAPNVRIPQDHLVETQLACLLSPHPLHCSETHSEKKHLRVLKSELQHALTAQKNRSSFRGCWRWKANHCTSTLSCWSLEMKKRWLPITGHLPWPPLPPEVASLSTPGKMAQWWHGFRRNQTKGHQKDARSFRPHFPGCKKHTLLGCSCPCPSCFVNLSDLQFLKNPQPESCTIF